MSRRRARTLAVLWALVGVLELAVAVVSSTVVAHVFGGVTVAISVGLSAYYWRRLNTAQ